MKSAPHVPPIDSSTFPGNAHLSFPRWPPHDSEYQPVIRAAEAWVGDLQRWERANFPRSERLPHRVSYAAPGDDFGPGLDVTADAWLDLASADGRTIRVCVDLSDACGDGVVTLQVHGAVPTHAPQPAAS